MAQFDRFWSGVNRRFHCVRNWPLDCLGRAVHNTTARPHHTPRDYSQTPVNVYWEITGACALACRHCRAEAAPTPDPLQLTFDEGVAFLKQITEFGDPMPQLILTGGDPLERPDLYEIIDEARRLGIGVSITPAATPALTRDVLVRLQRHGVEGLGLSLDGCTAELHDAIRGVPGTFDRTIQAMHWAKELGMPLQVNTLAAAETAVGIPAVYELLKSCGVFTLEPVLPDLGRARQGVAAAFTRGRGRTDGVGLPDVESRAVRGGHHRGAVLPASGARTNEGRGHDG